jgi:hypothetical protein
VDDKTGRIILFSDEPNPTVAALIQGDVQASFPVSKVIVARPKVVDLGALVRSVFSDAATAKFAVADFKKVSDELNKLSEKEKTRHYVTDVDHLIKVTAEGTTARTKIRATPRESVISKLLNRFKFEVKVNIRASTKDLGASR